MSAVLPKKWPQAVLFDWDGTIAETWMACYGALEITLKHYNLTTPTVEEYLNMPPLSVRDEFISRFPTHQVLEAERFYYEHAYKQSCHQNIKLLQRACEVIQRLNKQNIPLAILSNKAGPIVRHEAECLGVAENFKIILGSRDTHSDKPNAAMALKIFDHLQLKPSGDVWLLGDSHIDALCALNANCRAFIIGEEACEMASSLRPQHPYTHGLHSMTDWGAFLDFLNTLEDNKQTPLQL